jgi:hypothetical protein
MGLLLMLMTIGGVVAAAVLLLLSVVAKKAWLGTFVFGGVVVWFAFYLAMLFGTSVSSNDRELSFNESKKFCGFYLDCHLNVALKAVRRADRLGKKTADGEFYVVKVEIFSDAAKAELALQGVDVHVIDNAGRIYNRDTVTEMELAPQPEFEKLLGPEESFVKEIVFDLPNGIENPRLDIKQGHPIERMIESLLINDEDSMLHGRVYFTLVP